MALLTDTDQDGHTLDEGFAMGADFAGGVAKGGGALAMGVGALGTGIGTAAMGVGGLLTAGSGALMGVGGLVAGAGLAAGIPTLGLSAATAGTVGAAMMGVGAIGTMAGAGLTGFGGLLGLGGATLAGAGGLSVGIGELLQTDLAGAGAAELGDFTNDQINDTTGWL